MQPLLKFTRQEIQMLFFTQAPLHYEILISNKHRAIRETEIEAIQEFFLKRKIDNDH